MLSIVATMTWYHAKLTDTSHRWRLTPGRIIVKSLMHSSTLWLRLYILMGYSVRNCSKSSIWEISAKARPMHLSNSSRQYKIRAKGWSLRLSYKKSWLEWDWRDACVLATNDSEYCLEHCPESTWKSAICDLAKFRTGNISIPTQMTSGNGHKMRTIF